MPVVESSGHLMGTVTLMDLTKKVIASNSLAHEHVMEFSEPSHFPENVVLTDGAVVHDEDMVEPEAILAYQAVEPDNAKSLGFDTTYFDGGSFSENSVFPELTREEEVLYERVYGEVQPTNIQFEDPQELKIVTAQSQLLSEMDYFSEASDFPEAPPVDEAIKLRAA